MVNIAAGKMVYKDGYIDNEWLVIVNNVLAYWLIMVNIAVGIG